MVFDRLPKSSRVVLLQIYLKKTQLGSLGANNEHRNTFDQRPEDLTLILCNHQKIAARIVTDLYETIVFE